MALEVGPVAIAAPVAATGTLGASVGAVRVGPQAAKAAMATSADKHRANRRDSEQVIPFSLELRAHRRMEVRETTPTCLGRRDKAILTTLRISVLGPGFVAPALSRRHAAVNLGCTPDWRDSAAQAH